MFKKDLQFHSTILFCYNKQIIVKVTSQVLSPLTWHISQIIADCLSLIIFAYVLN
jgi:hypothetical protein